VSDRSRQITGVRKFRQALASPYPGRNIHDLAATIEVTVVSDGLTAQDRRE
jgi:hypothetical protein